MKIMQEDLCWVYITFSSKKEARFIGKILVKQNLVACVNILGEMISIFKWKGKASEWGQMLNAFLENAAP